MNTPPKGTQAVIFDMDGILLDSEPLHFEALNLVLAAEGHCLTEADNEHILGTTLEETFAHIARSFGLKNAPEAYFQPYDQTVLDILSRPLDASPGVEALLGALTEAGTSLAVASSSRRTWVDATLNSLGIQGFFPVVVSGEDVERGKPEPDIYLLAAERLLVAPSASVAIEDSPKGISSAKRARMTVLAVRTPYTAHLDLGEADMVVESLEEVGPAELGIG